MANAKEAVGAATFQAMRIGRPAKKQLEHDHIVHETALIKLQKQDFWNMSDLLNLMNL